MNWRRGNQEERTSRETKSSPPESHVGPRQAEERRRDELGAEIITRGKIDIRLFDRCAVEAEVRRQLGRWRQELLATRVVSDGRQLLRETLAGPLRMTPAGRSFRFEGEGVGIGHLLASLEPMLTQIWFRYGVLRKVGT
jgi:hypothetical protein